MEKIKMEAFHDEEEKNSPQASYRDTISINDSFARLDVIEKQKSFTHASSEIKWQYANFLGGTQEDNID